MIGLSDGIGSVRVVIGAPQQTRLSRSLLTRDVLRIALERGIRGFMNYTDNPFVFHRHEIRPHQVVMREIHDGAIGEGANLQRLKQKENAENGKFHPGTAGEYQSTIESCRKAHFTPGLSSFYIHSKFYRCAFHYSHRKNYQLHLSVCDSLLKTTLQKCKDLAGAKRRS